MGQGLQWTIEVAKGSLPFVLTALVAWIAWEQMRTARRKLRLDLFDRRLAIHSFFEEFIYCLLALPEGPTLDQLWARFDEMREAAEMLFGPDAGARLDELNAAVDRYWSLRGKPDEMSSKKALVAAQERVRESTRPFLDFRDVR